VFCPSCRSEFRSGFTHCASCDVDLVDSLDAPGGPPDLPLPGATSAPATRSRSVAGSLARGVGVIPDQPPVAFCGFLTLDEAIESRAKLKAEGVKSEILIREDDAVGTEPPRDTHWLRLSPAFFKKAADLLGYDAVAASSDDEDGEEAGDMVACSECGEDVGADESFCPHCGAKFEE